MSILKRNGRLGIKKNLDRLWRRIEDHPLEDLLWGEGRDKRHVTGTANPNYRKVFESGLG